MTFKVRQSNFNSKVVRLKALRSSLTRQSFGIFQFQSGAVKSKKVIIPNIPKFYFNSKVVRLKAVASNINDKILFCKYLFLFSLNEIGGAVSMSKAFFIWRLGCGDIYEVVAP